eukprot:3696568-Amphidinium_carterae.2
MVTSSGSSLLASELGPKRQGLMLVPHPNTPQVYWTLGGPGWWNASLGTAVDGHGKAAQARLISH